MCQQFVHLFQVSLLHTGCLSPIFTWIALSDVDLCFSLILVTEASAFEGGTTSAL